MSTIVVLQLIDHDHHHDDECPNFGLITAFSRSSTSSSKGEEMKKEKWSRLLLF